MEEKKQNGNHEPEKKIKPLDPKYFGHEDASYDPNRSVPKEGEGQPKTVFTNGFTGLCSIN